MFVLSKIYTRTGDAGDTALGDGTRVRKHALRVESYGTVDELNSTLGLARLQAQGTPVDADLAAIQNDLFDLGADLCRPEGGEGTALRVSDGQVDRLEAQIDAMTSRLEPLRSFVLPGGTALSAHLHLCRTVARRAERLVVALSEQHAVNPAAIRYLNRLSDWFFVAARMANDGGRSDVLWVPGANR
ncbi:cob(I)yrinic acid a,c-diamide adenosyltransferase [Rubellimicrobium roseum]|uniref:Corrinoid adenosyltransferase n=1 Tax=Rubellimicrobium roseum TaxID=687525 RepID=A0A5C4NCM4_9RHOB|nr:cob(I)yrinic acid a,c-diamide adenosyltransferase [Rubellimicrobium roseum]TNC70314.1 cob(I)yrinic acid a,c-diamide adenosyltransferase [Rubellimicrobium roseum]